MILLFRKADIKDPPDCSNYEHYYHKKTIYSPGLLFRKANIEDPPDSSIHEHYEHSRGFLFREASIEVFQTAASMNIIKALFQKIKASSQQ
jgi:hypothetical protein